MNHFLDYKLHQKAQNPEVIVTAFISLLLETFLQITFSPSHVLSGFPSIDISILLYIFAINIQVKVSSFTWKKNLIFLSLFIFGPIYKRGNISLTLHCSMTFHCLATVHFSTALLYA